MGGEGERGLVHPGAEVEGGAGVGHGLVGEEGLGLGGQGARGLDGRLEVVGEFGAGDVAEEDGLARVGDDGEAATRVASEDGGE